MLESKAQCNLITFLEGPRPITIKETYQDNYPCRRPVVLGIAADMAWESPQWKRGGPSPMCNRLCNEVGYGIQSVPVL